MRLSQKGIKNIKRGLYRSWENGTHRQRQREREIDADTIRKRVLYDARGKIIFTAIFPRGDKMIVQRSLYGRTDQFDVMDSDKTVFTGRLDLCAKFLMEASIASENIDLDLDNPKSI